MVRVHLVRGLAHEMRGFALETGFPVRGFRHETPFLVRGLRAQCRYLGATFRRPE